MRRSRPLSRAACVAATALLTGLAVLTGGTALADDAQTTIDVLKVVDGEYVVETVTVPARTADASADQLEDRAEVLVASPAVTYELETSDPFWEDDDPQAVSGAELAWARTRGEGQVVAVLDTAGTISHPDLAGAVLPGADMTNGNPADPSHGHGVAGVIAARADNGEGGAGIAPESRILPVRVCIYICTSADVARGVLWAADHGADVINLSLSGPGWSDVTGAAIQYALAKNVSVVASAGNSGDDGNAIHYPAANSGVIAVGATTAVGAPSTWSQHGWQVDMSTVGEDVLLTEPGGEYSNAWGTSFSGPAVAGAVALLRAAKPGVSVTEIQAALQAGADSDGGWNRAWGAGRLDVPAALEALDRLDGGVTVTPGAQSAAVAWAAVPGAAEYNVRVDGVSRAVVTGTSATIAALVDGNQVAVDVQPSNGARSKPVLATVGTAAPGIPVLHSATLSGSASNATLSITVSASGGTGTRLSLVRDGINIGGYSFAVTSSQQTVGISLGAMPTNETRWQVQYLDSRGRMSVLSNAVTTGSAKPPLPAAVTGLAAQPDGDDVLLTWNRLGAAYTYRVTVDGVVVAAPRTEGASVAGPAVGETRTFAVVAVDATGQTGPPVTVDVTRGTDPAVIVAPAVLGATRVGETVHTSDVFSDADSVTHTWRACDADGCVQVAGDTSHLIASADLGKQLEVEAVATSATGSTTVVSPRSAPVADGITVPAAPSLLTATPISNGAQLYWAAPDDGGSQITSYIFRVYTGGALAFTQGYVAQIPLLFYGLSNGTAYTFTVAAGNAIGEGPPSPMSSTVTPRSSPQPPVIGTATAGDGAITLTWSPPNNDGGSPITCYTVSTSVAGVLTSSDQVAAEARSLTVTGLTNGVPHYAWVTAMNAGGPSMGSSNQGVTVTPRGKPDAPVIRLPRALDGSAMVRWSAPAFNGGAAITGYTVRTYDGPTLVRSDGAPPGAINTYVGSLVNGTEYTFTVTATNVAGTGAASANSVGVVPEEGLVGPPELTMVHRLGAGMNLWGIPLSDAETDYGTPGLVRSLNYGGFSYDGSRTLTGNFGNVSGSDDGSPDHVIWHAQPNGGVLVWAVGGGGDTTPKLWLNLLTGGWAWAHSNPVVGDVNDDGWDDLLVRHTNGPSTANVWVFLSDGEKIGAPQLWGTTGLGLRALMFDVDGDERDDMLMGRSFGSGLRYDVLQVNAGGTAFDRTLTSVFTGSPSFGWSYAASRVVTGDVTGDGLDDIVTLHAQGANPGLLVWVHENCTVPGGAACFEQPRIWQDLRTGGWSYAGSRQYLADSDGDGVQDLISVHSQAGNSGVLVWRHLSDTTRLGTPQIVSDLRVGGWNYTASRASVN